MNYSFLFNKNTLQYVKNCIRNSEVYKVKKTKLFTRLEGIYNLVSEGDTHLTQGRIILLG